MKIKTGRKKMNFPGYPEYPARDDIYHKSREEKNIDPENPFRNKGSDENGQPDIYYKKDPNQELSGNDLDIPGSELDDSQEIVGSEDEENNFYSLGGDDHNDLDEDNGDSVDSVG